MASSYYEALPIFRAAMDCAVRISAAVDKFPARTAALARRTVQPNRRTETSDSTRQGGKGLRFIFHILAGHRAGGGPRPPGRSVATLDRSEGIDRKQARAGALAPDLVLKAVGRGVRLGMPGLGSVAGPVRCTWLREPVHERVRTLWASYEGHLAKSAAFRLRDHLWRTHPNAARPLRRAQGGTGAPVFAGETLCLVSRLCGTFVPGHNAGRMRADGGPAGSGRAVCGKSVWRGTIRPETPPPSARPAPTPGPAVAFCPPPDRTYPS